MVFIASTLSGRVTGRFGPRLPMVIGLAVGSAGLLGMILAGAATNYIFICPMLLAAGFGTAFTMPAMTNAVIENAPEERSGIALAVLNASRQVGVALLGSLISRRVSFVPGMHIAAGVAGGVFLIGCVLSFFAVQQGKIKAEI